MATVDLSKAPKVNLTKGQTVNLTKDGTSNTANLTNVFFGAKWGSIVRGHKEVKGGFLRKLLGKVEEVFVPDMNESVDLDASLLLYDSNKSLIDTVYFGHKQSTDGAISHSGDDLHGTAGSEQEQDNETISIDLTRVTSRAQFIVAILNSYQHHKFDQIPYMKLRIYTGRAGRPEEVLCAYNLENNSSFVGKEAIVLGYFYRSGNGWKFKADGTTSRETSIGSIARGTALEVIRKH